MAAALRTLPFQTHTPVSSHGRHTTAGSASAAAAASPQAHGARTPRPVAINPIISHTSALPTIQKPATSARRYEIASDRIGSVEGTGVLPAVGVDVGHQ